MVFVVAKVYKTQIHMGFKIGIYGFISVLFEKKTIIALCHAPYIDKLQYICSASPIYRKLAALH